MTTVLEFQDIARSYTKGTPVLDGVTFSVAEGEVVGLLGRNGAGKTTLIRIAMGTLFPQRGSVRVFGLSPTDEPVAVKRRVGYVAEDQVLPGRLSIADLIGLHKYLFPRWNTALERQLLDRFELAAGSKIKSLSKGQARQVALLCAVCHYPELPMLDEPAGGLDPVARREFLETSIQLLNREGTAILFSSHHMADVERIGGRVVLLDKGRLRLDREVDSLREETCVAVVPHSTAPNTLLIKQVPGFLSIRVVRDDWHAVFDGPPVSVHEQLQRSLGTNGIRCTALPLEELFIELAEGERS